MEAPETVDDTENEPDTPMMRMNTAHWKKFGPTADAPELPDPSIDKA